MAAPMEKTKLSKSDRKMRKKQLKSKNMLLKHDGIDSSDTPTKILCVNNAGLDNGVAVEEVDAIFSPYGDIDDIIMLPQKPYSFVCYNIVEDALRAYENLNGIEINPASSRNTSLTLCILFVSKVPSSLSPSSELPPGLILLENFVTQEYSQQLLTLVDTENSQSTEQELKHRQVIHFGYEFKYGINDVDADDPLPNRIPDICSDLIDKAIHTGYVHYCPDQLTINIYQSGQGIPPHVDTPAAFEDGIMSLSLGSQVLMDFRHPKGKHLSVLLPPLSLLIMTGESRYLWSHGITPRKSDIVSTDKGLTVMKRGIRTSFTFRKIIPPKERVSRTIPSFLDEDNSKASLSEPSDLPNSDQDAQELEKLHVHEVYEEIADHFSGTRHTAWPRISDFLMAQPLGSLVADIGCGNGKYLSVNKNLYMVGSDRSKNLVQICQERNFEVFVGDVLSIPFKTGSLDVCLCIAVIHHLSTQERRQSAVCELLRILRPGGKALIYVWAMEQELNNVKSKYLRECKFEAKEDSKINESLNFVDDNGSSSKHKNINECSTETSRNENISMKNIEDDKEVDAKPKKDENCEVQSGCENCEVSLTSSFEQHVGEQKSHEESGSHECFQTESRLCESLSNECRKLEIHTNRTQFKQQDLLVPWQLKNKDKSKKVNEENGPSTYHRYYHVFKKGELERMCEGIKQCKVINSYYDQGNWAVILEKLG